MERKQIINKGSKFSWKFWIFEHDNGILSYDREVMSAYNVWPVDGVNVRFACHCVLFFIIPGYIYCIKNNPDLMNFSSGIFEQMSMHFFVLKYFISYIYRGKITQLIDGLQSAWTRALQDNIPDWNDEQIKFEEWTILYEKITMLYIKIGTLFYCITPVVLSLFNKLYYDDNHLPLILKSEFIYDVTSNIYVYLLYLLIIVPTGFRFGSMTQAYDNMVFNILMHIGKNFEFVEIKLKNLNEELMKLTEVELQQNEKQIIKQLIDIVDLHNEAIDFVGQCDTIISPIVLATYTINTFMFGLLSFILTIENDITYILKMIFTLTLITGQTFLPSFACGEIIDRHKLIGVQAYNIQWYNKSPAITKILQMIIMRSQRTVGVTAGKFYFVSLHSFGSMLKAAGSYFTLIQSLYDHQ